MKSVAVAIILIFMSATAFAWCEKYPDISIADELKKSDFVVIGSVASRLIVVDPIEDPKGYEAEIFKFKIEDVLSGPPKKEINLYNVNTSARFPMDVGKRYFIFVRSDDSGYWVDNCGNSDEYENSSKNIAEVRRLLKRTHNQENAPGQKPAR